MRSVVRKFLRRPEWGLIAGRIVGTVRRDDMTRLGSSYGGWWVPASLITQESICYCAGVGEDISFDLQLIRDYGCSVWAFDPTPRVVEWIRQQPTPEGFRFVPFGLWKQDGPVRFFAPRNRAHESHSISNVQDTTDFFEGECRRVISAMHS